MRLNHKKGLLVARSDADVFGLPKVCVFADDPLSWSLSKAPSKIALCASRRICVHLEGHPHRFLSCPSRYPICNKESKIIWKRYTDVNTKCALIYFILPVGSASLVGQWLCL